MFYDRLNQLCRSRGMNITDVAVNQLKVANSAPTSWKKGASPRSDIVIRAAAYFGVSADYLLGLTELPVPPAANEGAAPEIQAVIAQLVSASPQARNAAIAAMEAVLHTLDS